MITVKGEKIAYVDCDDTLVYWSSSQEDKEKYGVRFYYPDFYESELLVPNLAQIEHLKKLKLRHHTIVVWSAAGSSWATEVVQRLGLEPYVDLCISKPTQVYDDLPVSEFMPASRLITKESK